jgi:beta-lactamase regulating signal transducer with metallopeptidase domain
MTWAEWVLGNAVAATALGAVVALVQRRVRSAALVHAAWGVVLLRLVAFPAVEWPVLPSWPAADTAPDVRRAAIHPGPRAATPPARPLSEAVPALPPAGRATPPAVGLLAFAALAGTATLLSLAVARAARLRRLLRAAADAPVALRARADEVAREIGLPRAPQVRLVPARIPPAVLAAPRPEILLPRTLVAKLPADQLDALLAHELAHVRRGDPWWRPLELVILALWWWHPVAWWARRNFRAAEERACDELVVRRRPHGVRAYADALVTAAEFLAAVRPRTSVLVTGLDVRPLQERLTMILDRHSARPLGRGWILLSAFALLAALVVVPSGPGDAAVTAGNPGAPAPAADPAPAPPAATAHPPVPGVPAPATAPTPPPPEADVPAPAGAPEALEERIALEREIRALELRRIGLQRRAQALDARFQTDRMRAEVAELRREGRAEDAARVAERLAAQEAEMARHLARQEQEWRHAASRMEAELKLRALELSLSTMEGTAPAAIEAAQREVEMARRRLAEAELEAMQDEVRRMTEEIQARADALGDPKTGP